MTSDHDAAPSPHPEFPAAGDTAPIPSWFAESGTEEPAAPVQPAPEPSDLRKSGFVLPETGQLGFPLPPAAVNGWKERDSFIHLCIKLGLTAPEISRLSLSTPQPLKTHQQVYDKIEQLGLDRLYKS